MSVRDLKISALFAPPDRMHGTNLLMCGMSAHVEILEVALEAFTSQTKEARRMQGRLVGLLLLDAAQPLISPTNVPGLYHLPPCAKDLWSVRTALLSAPVPWP